MLESIQAVSGCEAQIHPGLVTRKSAYSPVNPLDSIFTHTHHHQPHPPHQPFCWLYSSYPLCSLLSPAAHLPNQFQNINSWLFCFLPFRLLSFLSLGATLSVTDLSKIKLEFWLLTLPVSNLSACLLPHMLLGLTSNLLTCFLEGHRSLLSPTMSSTWDFLIKSLSTYIFLPVPFLPCTWFHLNFCISELQIWNTTDGYLTT